MMPEVKAVDARMGVKRPLSLIGRVTVLVGVGIALAFLAFNWIFTRAIEQHFAQQDEASLRSALGHIASVLESAGGADAVALQVQLAQLANSNPEGLVFAVATENGQMLFRQPGPDLLSQDLSGHHTPAFSAHTQHAWVYQGTTFHGLSEHVKTGHPSANYHVGVGMDMDFHLGFLQQLQRIQWWASAVAIALALVLIGAAVHWGLAPLRRVNRHIQGINLVHLDKRLSPQDVPRELGELVNAFNAMLDRIEDGYARLSHFSANIAHELRTPVTKLSTQMQVSLGMPRTAQEYREVLYSSLEELEHMARMVADMLFLAQTDNAQDALTMEGVDVDTLVTELFDYFDALAEEQGIALRLDGHLAPVPANKMLLRRAISNLLANAIRHSEPGAQVTVRLSTMADARQASIAVENTGIPIPAEHLGKLFDRFYQVDPSRQHHGAGAGLGLAIVRAIAQAHAGTVHAHSDAQRTSFEMRIPASRS